MVTMENGVISLDKNMDVKCSSAQLVFLFLFGNLDVDLTTIILHVYSTNLNKCYYKLQLHALDFEEK